MEILIPVIVLGLIGLVMGSILAVASKVFQVETDPREEKVSALLPGANCGGCGFAGCAACAAAIAKGDAPVAACPGISAEALKEICAVMGVNEQEKTPMAAFVQCNGQLDKANFRYFFDGSKTCADIAALQQGDKLCAYACLGYGDCVQACNFGALSIENGIAKVHTADCVGCGVCVKTCPKQVLALMPKNIEAYAVKCSSKDKGAAMKEICSAGCIGCKLCEKACAFGAVKVENNLAKIDTQKCTGCGACAEKCPKHIIVGIGKKQMSSAS